MAQRGRKPKNLAPHDPDQYVVTMQRGRLCWHPDVLPAIVAWIDMQIRIHTEGLKDAQAMHQKTASVIRRQLVSTLEETIRGLEVIESMVAQPWRRIEWNPSVIKVMDAIDPANAETFPDSDPAA